MMLSKEKIAAMDHNFVVAMGVLMSNSVLGEFFDSYRAGIYNSGLPDDHWNVVFVKRTTKKTREVMEKWEQFFASRGLPFRVFFPPDLEDAFLPLLQEKGYTKSDAMPVMTLDAFSGKTDESSGLVIRKVTTPEELRDYQEAAEKGFSLPAGSGSYVMTEQTFMLPEVDMLIGYTDGKPACTSMLFPTGAVAGIYWVSTVPEYRNRGFGAAITMRAVMAGREKGCSLSVLQASAMGKPIYERIGFDHPYDYQVYRSPV